MLTALSVFNLAALAVEFGRGLAAHLLLDPPHVLIDAGSAGLVQVAGCLAAGNPIEGIAPRRTEGKLRDQLLHVRTLAMLAVRLLVISWSADQHRGDFLAVAAAVFVERQVISPVQPELFASWFRIHFIMGESLLADLQTGCADLTVRPGLSKRHLHPS